MRFLPEPTVLQSPTRTPFTSGNAHCDTILT